MSLAGLERRRGHADRARELVTDARGSISEGFETSDLRDALAFMTG
jgi:hypothetical protein